MLAVEHVVAVALLPDELVGVVATPHQVGAAGPGDDVGLAVTVELVGKDGAGDRVFATGASNLDGAQVRKVGDVDPRQVDRVTTRTARTEKPVTCLQPMKGSSPLTFTSPLTHEIRIRSSASLSTLTTSVPAWMECVTVAEAGAGATSKTRATAMMPVAAEFGRKGRCRRIPELLVVSWAAREAG